MRDPQRIDRTLKRLRKYWKKYPDMRLGQIIENATPEGVDVFYVEDDVVESNIPEVP